MPKAQANGIEIEYESFGSGEDETILLIMGLGARRSIRVERPTSRLSKRMTR